jgi:hypothetical protein
LFVAWSHVARALSLSERSVPGMSRPETVIAALPPRCSNVRNLKRGTNHQMKFGIFYELQLPRPWDADSEYRLYHDALSQLELADQLGYDYAWEVEHHFLEEYSHSSAPEVFLVAASQRTRNIRLGHGIVQLTTSHPAKVVERVAASAWPTTRPTPTSRSSACSCVRRRTKKRAQRWKRRVLSGEIMLEEIDTEPFKARYGTKAVTL